MEKEKDDLTVGSQASQPTNVFHLLPLLSFLAPAFGSVAGQGTEALLKHVQSPDAIFVQVLDSKQVGDKHQVQFKVTNQTLHGAYIESAVLKEPEVGSTPTPTVPADPHAEAMSFGEKPATVAPQAAFPRLLSSGDAMRFDLEFTLGGQKGKKKPDSAGKLELNFSRLDQSKAEKKTVTFLIRWNDPKI
jgi:hypothetical protein